MRKINLKRFSKTHYSGILILAILICGIQIILLFVKKYDFAENDIQTKEEAEWLAQQNQLIDHNDFEIQHSKIYPFNPNFISDYKGYKLGMSVEQLDRLFAFRKQGKFINSVNDFQKITQVSDQWIKQYASYFKFPDWVHQKNKNDFPKKYKYEDFSTKKILEQKDINVASQEDLEAVYMIGEKTALKILEHREKLGAFVSLQQLENIWGIAPEALTELNKKFKVILSSNLKKININTASLKELGQFPLFNFKLAKNIITYRSMNQDFISVEQLKSIKDFPVEKYDYIKDYIIL